MEEILVKKEVPKVLVQTWISLIRNDANEEVQKRALEMLKSALGSTQNIADYMKKNNIR